MTYHDSNQCQMWLEELREEAKYSINLGCGSLTFGDSINCDMYGDQIDIRLDAKMLPFANDSIDMIEAHQLLEHISHRETEIVLREWRRCLKDQGFLIVSVPDCEIMCALAMSRRTEAIPARAKWKALSLFFYGSQTEEGQYHKAGFAPEQLKQILMDEGFEIRGIWRGFPPRPTPSFCIVAKKEGGMKQ